MSQTLKITLIVSVGVILVMVLFLGGFLLGRFTAPLYQGAMISGRGWQSSGFECRHDQLPYPHRPGSGMFDGYQPGSDFYHHEGMPFWDPNDR
jgi:hypothetical protein